MEEQKTEKKFDWGLFSNEVSQEELRKAFAGLEFKYPQEVLDLFKEDKQEDLKFDFDLKF